MSSKTGISVKGTMDFNSVTTFLEDLVKSFKEQQVVVQRGDEYVTLVPTDSIDLELEAAVKKGKQKLTVELAWREAVQPEEEVTFRVTSKEPEPRPVPIGEVVCATVCADNPENAKKAMESAAEAAAAKVEDNKKTTAKK
ncbi:MAG: amphi-Trp domain-containing protein [Oceanidesulfovibrio sp.]